MRIRGVDFPLLRKVSVDFVRNKERPSMGNLKPRWVGSPCGAPFVVQRGSEDGSDQGQEAQFLCLAVLREGGSLGQGEEMQTEPDK